LFKKNRFFVWDSEKNPDPGQKIEFLFFLISFQKNSKFKIYYAKWTLRIEVVCGQNNICYCIFRVYFVTGTKNPDISQEGTFRITKKKKIITTRGSSGGRARAGAGDLN
jgi:hypothetical protein